MKKPLFEVPDQFIQKIQESMQIYEISLRQAARESGLSPSYLSRILKKERNLPSNETIGRLAVALKITPQELLLLAGRYTFDASSEISQLLFKLTEEQLNKFAKAALREGLAKGPSKKKK
jgi:transcriptional regulator with XRE-family HTH domain